ncbi:MAG: fumarylacetoacetate hydrolase family protein [Acidobacteria bacterium]|nr:fumarylacetoacetate hydrolase family protein [Acidobacteriota bacterium]
MKIYKVKSGILIESEDRFYLQNSDWDEFIDSDELFAKTSRLIAAATPLANGEDLIRNELLPPIGSQEIWASGVTYFNSKLAREQESKDAGGGDFYARVYVADRPELFFKSAGFRAVGSGGKVRIRRDSTWDVPEPELTLLISSGGKIVGFTIGNDMSSRSIEGQNPLYLPQAKSYDGSAAVGPCILVSEAPPARETEIEMIVRRNGETVFEGKTDLGQIRRDFDELASWLFREMSFPAGCFLMTGTGIIPSNDFTLRSGDEIRITIEPIGTLVNFVE